MRMDYFSNQIEEQLPGSKATVTGDGSKFEALVISEAFEGKNTLTRHKMIYAILNEYITNGMMHALSIKSYTPEEYEKKHPEADDGTTAE